MWLGVRCWKDKIALVVVQDGATPEVVFRRRQSASTSTDPGQRLAWFAKAVTEAIEETGCDGVSVRIADSSPDQDRAEAEGAVLAASAISGKQALRYRRQSMMKPLKVDRSAGAWNSFQRSDAFIGGLIGDEKDAAMASLAAARK